LTHDLQFDLSQKIVIIPNCGHTA